jgi:hypothetical protein
MSRSKKNLFGRAVSFSGSLFNVRRALLRAVSVPGIVSMFEKRLKELNPTLPSISYDISDLYTYIDTFNDFSALVYVKVSPALLLCPCPCPCPCLPACLHACMRAPVTTYVHTFVSITADVARCMLVRCLSVHVAHRLDPAAGKYDPFPKEWVKEQVFNLLRRQAHAGSKGR